MGVYKLLTHARNEALGEQIDNLKINRAYTLIGIKHLVNGDAGQIRSALHDAGWIRITWRNNDGDRQQTVWIARYRVWIDERPLDLRIDIPLYNPLAEAEVKRLPTSLDSLNHDRTYHDKGIEHLSGRKSFRLDMTRLGWAGILWRKPGGKRSVHVWLHEKRIMIDGEPLSGMRKIK